MRLSSLMNVLTFASLLFISCLQMKDMRHENINTFVGIFHDCGVFAILTEFCSRGSLEDLLTNEDVKLDWMFKSSLLLDLIKVKMEGLERKIVSWRLWRLKVNKNTINSKVTIKTNQLLSVLNLRV